MRQFLSLLILLLSLQSQVSHGLEVSWLNQDKLQGQFTQEKHLAALSRPFVSHGEYLYSKETGLQWHTLKPVNNYLLINKNGVSEKQADGQYKILTSDTSFSALLLPIFSGDFETLKQHFSISETNTGLTLKPLDQAVSDVMQSLELIISEQALQQITLYEANGNLTQIYLRDNTQPAEHKTQ
ncbi:outer membrane lipoprotein carrier protein LolA [Paraglaciecola sp. 2405UD69-4]|uniref:outer membrane lipoprotein carrier protein LolA n=1 Tax=Paraglaciecola sp. 2405UD69-4 TaxID=3391836 RepID=UPI0039C8D7E6